MSSLRGGVRAVLGCGSFPLFRVCGDGFEVAFVWVSCNVGPSGPNGLPLTPQFRDRHFAAGNASSVCTPCGPSTFSAPDRASCLRCPPDSVSLGSAGICTPCLEDEYANGEGTSCIRCAEGFVVNAERDGCAEVEGQRWVVGGEGAGLQRS